MMAKISRPAIHEAGHALACVAFGGHIVSIYIGGCDSVNNKGTRADGQVVRTMGRTGELVVRHSGYVAECIWVKKKPDIKTFSSNFYYGTDSVVISSTPRSPA